MSEQLLVQFSQLQAASGHINAAISALHSGLADLESTAQPLVAGWRGDAVEAYRQRQRQWTEAAHGLTEILTGIRRALEESTEQYAATEKANTNLFT